jgi:hypothetical protein
MFFKIFSLSLDFRSLIMLCLCTYFFGLIIFGVHSPSCTCRFMSLVTFRKFPIIVSSSNFSVPPSFYSPSRTVMPGMLCLLLVTQVPLQSVLCSLSIISIVLSSRALILSSVPSIPLWNTFTELLILVITFFPF